MHSGAPSGATELPVPHLLNPPPPQKSGAVHVPQSSWPPQPSPANPHVKPSFAHVVGVQLGPVSAAEAPPQRLNPPPPQKSDPVHVPQLSGAPQPSPANPQVYPRSLQLLGVHGEPPSDGVPLRPHRLNPPPPQKFGELQVPQLICPPHPSPAAPQS